MPHFLSLVTGGFVALSTPSVVLAQAQTDYHGPHMMGGSWFMGPIMMIVFLAVAVIVVMLIVRWMSGSNQGQSQIHASPPARAAIDILKERFARGEIDKEEFEERRRILES
jgi:putative membrane protein|tara:strand:+ start:278 stop:610 length:333 start_codon:yes stop_codon:yes gene_type:complete